MFHALFATLGLWVEDGRSGAGGAIRISLRSMLLHLYKKLPPEFTKANDSDLNFLNIFLYPSTVALSSGDFFCFLWSRAAKGDGPTTVDLIIHLVHRLQDLPRLFLQ